MPCPRVLRRIAIIIATVLVGLFCLWAFGALWFDFPLLPCLAAMLFAAALVGIGVWIRPMRNILAGMAGLSLLVLVWWLTLQPSNDRQWQEDVARTAWAETNGDRITIHNVRSFDYPADGSMVPHWQTRTIDLAKLTGLDIAINYWGSEWMAHPILSFQFADAEPLCFSIETRKEIGEDYSAIGGIYRQYELIVLASVERDVLRVRTNHRHGESVYLYHTTLGADAARIRLREYINTINRLNQSPVWYNAVTKNCTTSIRSQHDPARRIPWDWRILLNGKMDRMLYDDGVLADGGAGFQTLRAQALINQAALAADPADFSAAIRQNRIGFAPASATP